MSSVTQTISPVRKSRILQREQDAYAYKDDILAAEEPLEISIYFASNPEKLYPFMVNMRTPGNDEDFITGLLFSEGIIYSMMDIEDIVFDAPHQAKVCLGNHITFPKLKTGHTSTSACGACGKPEISALGLNRLQKASSKTRFYHLRLSTVYEQLNQSSSLFNKTGGMHGAFLIDSQSSEVLIAREDIGRHNAVDKVIGATLRSHMNMNDNCLAVTSRIGFEIAQKAISADISLIIALGAASSMAVEVADKFDVCLVGFLSPNKHNIYTHTFRLLKDTSEIQ